MILSSNTKCKIIIFSDIHYAAEKPIHNGSIIDRKLTHLALPLTKKLINTINEIKPDIVINLGDLIEDSGNHDIDIIDLKFIWNLLKDIKAPFYSLIGNHELRSMSCRKEIEEIMGYENATFSINFKGYHFVFLAPEVNNQIGTEMGGILRTQYLTPQDLEWLKNDLQNNHLPCIIFSHFGLAEDDMIGNYWFEKHSANAFWANRFEIKQILNTNKNLLAVFSGHQHWTKDITEDNINYHLIGSLAEDIHNNGTPDGIYLEIDLENNKMHITKHNLKL